MAARRAVNYVLRASETVEGAGFTVRRPFPTGQLQHYDPFLLLDHLPDRVVEPGKAVGAPTHPHRGFVTLTHIVHGENEHKDSAGNHGVLGPGWVQWLTTGSGVLHSEMPTKKFMEEGGRAEGFQLWINLPAKDKMQTPRYQDTPPEGLPVVEVPGTDGKATVKVIVGDSYGVRSRIEPDTPVWYNHYIVKPGGRVSWQIPEAAAWGGRPTDGFNLFAYVAHGRARVYGPEGSGKDRDVGEMDTVFFVPGPSEEGEPEVVEFENPVDAKEDLMLLLLGGKPLKEPVARYGPFVMTTRDQIMQAVMDYQSGKFGAIDF
ncbi:pirin domain protein [Hyaloraphidium curvatum]|nr:pirin domain protein [Hyaloraphidium curvatum]